MKPLAAVQMANLAGQGANAKPTLQFAHNSQAVGFFGPVHPNLLNLHFDSVGAGQGFNLKTYHNGALWSNANVGASGMVDADTATGDPELGSALHQLPAELDL